MAGDGGFIRQADKRSTDPLDKRVAVAGAVGFATVGIALLVRINQPLYGMSSLLACVACVGYLLLRGRAALQVDGTHKTVWYDVGWLATWGAAIATYALRPEPYERPLAFFALVALSCGIIAAKIIRCQLASRDTAITLAQTVVIGLSLVWTVTLMYPTPIGIDPWTHRSIMLSGVDAGSWSTYPMWHRAWYGFIAVVTGYTGLEYRLATMVVSFIQVVGGASLLFLIGRQVAKEQVGLLAALIVAFSSWHIFFGYWTIPNGIGLTLVLLAIYLVIRHSGEGGKWPVCAFVVTLGLLLFTYLMAIAWLVALLCFWVILTLVRDRHLPRYRVILPLAGIGATVGMLGKTGFLHYAYDLLLGLALSPTSTTPTQTSHLFLDTVAQPSWEFAFNSLGMVLGFTIAIAGCLWLLSKQRRNTPSLLAVLSFGTFLAVGIVPALFGVSAIEHRWWFAAQAFAAIPIAVMVIALHKVGKGAVVTGGVVMLSFLMMIGLPCNMDNYTFSENQLARYALTQGELDAAEWALDKYDGDIGVDNYYTYAGNLIPDSGQRLVGINKEILASDYGSLECDTVLIRDAIVHDPFALGEGRVYRLLYDPNTVLVEAGYKLVYSADGVNGYAREGSTLSTTGVTWTRGGTANYTIIGQRDNEA